MFEFLIIEDLATRIYAQSAAILISGLVAAQLVHLLIRLIQKTITSKTETDLDDRIVSALEKSLKQILIFTSLYVAVHRLDSIHHGRWLDYVDGGFFIVMVLLSTILLSNIVKAVVEWYLATIAQRTDSPVDVEVIPLIRRITNILLYAIALMICLDHFHIDIKALVVSLGVGSFAIAFAAQETLANMIAGFVIMVDRPFRVGDRIRIPSINQLGDVVKVGLRSTQILDFDYNIVTVPNAQIVKSEIINFDYPEPATRLRIEVGVAYGTDIEKARYLLLSIPPRFDKILKDPPPEAAVIQFADSAVTLVLICRVRHYKDHFELGDTVRQLIHSEFRKAGIDIPFPQRVVHFQERADPHK